MEAVVGGERRVKTPSSLPKRPYSTIPKPLEMLCKRSCLPLVATFKPFCVVRNDFVARDPYEYEDRLEVTLRHELATAMCATVLLPGDLIVEAGCAEGLLTTRLAMALPSVRILALDCFDECVERTAQRTVGLENVVVVKQDVTQQPFPSPDMLLLMDVLLFLDGDAEVYRALSPGTWVLMSLSSSVGNGDVRTREQILAAIPDCMETCLEIVGMADMRLLRRR